MIRFSRLLAFLFILQTILAVAQTATAIPANEAAAHVNEWATVEGVVAKMFTSKTGNTFLNIGAAYPNQTFTGWIPPASPVNKSPILSSIEGKHVEITGRIEMYKGKPEIRINAASQLAVERIGAIIL
jgi:DNA/RNA endonuclease YhcR with UshA esterase domain